MNVTKPYKFIRFGAMDGTKPYTFIGFGAMDVTNPNKFIGFGAMDVTNPNKFIGFGAMDVTKPHRGGSSRKTKHHTINNTHEIARREPAKVLQCLPIFVQQ